MKTVCVGRFLIDLPAEAQVDVSQGYTGGFHFTSSADETEEEFADRLRALEEEVLASPSEDGRPALQLRRALSFDGAHGELFVYNRRRGETVVDDKVVEIEDVSVRAMLRFPGVSVSASADHMALDAGERLERLLRKTRPTGTDEIPAEKGFCIDHVMVGEPIEDADTEKVVMFAGLPDHPDVNIVLSSMAGTEPAPGLLARRARTKERLPVFVQLATTSLFERARSINGLAGEEVGLRVREPNFTTGYSFQWEKPVEGNEVTTPLLNLEFESGTNPVSGGKPVQSTLSEEAMLELWERISGSLRVRPAAAGKATAASPVPVALGTSALAGEVCPESGWWRCGDGGEGIGVFGGERQFLKKGQRMPQALLLPPPTLWQRLRGLQPSFESRNPTLWTLADKRATPRLAQAPGLAQALMMADAGRVPASASPTASVELPLGSVVPTGAACPASGWWRCEDSHALDGTRWFAAGSVLPAATFRTQIHGRGSGFPELIHRRSSWQLVRRADAEKPEHGADGVPPRPGPSGPSAA
ncbi:hypothetical protein B0920_07245 [Massilia sp. KIM]|uniref:T6SS immunity protein Tli4 family protein n=1 Tax=Massilia sp. KIM TaxID=1955422 RepID=UPI00098FB1EF|nr:T6SS immunity protein Tli4 family protein [Massilia sp. KIM]OON63191.1 hypothetical protein B0920_07245 [Massilia sp. KIM]